MNSICFSATLTTSQFQPEFPGQTFIEVLHFEFDGDQFELSQNGVTVCIILISRTIKPILYAH